MVGDVDFWTPMPSRVLVCAVLLATAATGCGRTASSTNEAASAASFDAWSDTFAQDWLRDAPQKATRTQYFSGDEQNTLDRQLSLVGEWGTIFGAGTAAKRAALARRGLDELRRIPSESMTPQQRTSAALLRWSLDDTVASAEFATHSYVFDQFNGLHLDLVNHLTQAHPIRQRQDVENYLARLAAVSPLIDQGLGEARESVAAGIVAPRFILERTIEQIDGFLRAAPRSNVYVSTLAERIGTLGEAIAPADRDTFVAAAEKTTAEDVIPAYRRVRDFLAEQLSKATDDAGVWRLPRGEAFYAQALRTFTTTSLTPDEIHAIGLREVARLEGEMDTILRQLGYTSGTVNARYVQLEAALQPKGSGDPRPGILADNEKWVRDAEQRAALLFDLRPKAPVVVRREPAFSEKTAAAHYTNPAPDGSRPGVFWLPLPGPPVLDSSPAVAHLPRGGAWPSLPASAAARDDRPAPVPKSRRDRRRLGVHRRVGALRRAAGGRERLVRRRSAWPPGVSEQYAVSRPPACGRHGHSRQAVDAAAGNRLRHQRAGGRTLRRVAGPGVRVHDRTAPDRRAPRQGAGGHGRPLPDQGVPQPRAPHRGRAAGRAGP